MTSRLLADPVFLKLCAAIVAPFLLWATIAIMARRRPELLPRIYPTIKAVTWEDGSFWLHGALTASMPGQAVLQSGSDPLVFVFRYQPDISLVTGYAAEFDPASYQKAEGWWPAPKDKAL